MAWRATWNEPPERRSFWTDRGGLFPPGVKLILILTVGVFLVEMAWPKPLMAWGALTVRDLLSMQVWRLVTYMFLHGSTLHILFNMFMLWMLGIALERQIGTRQFLALYFSCGVIGGVTEAVFNCLMFLRYGGQTGEAFLVMPAVGASAGVAGVLVAFAVRNPRAEFLLFFLLPIEAWMVALIYGIIETRHMYLALTDGFVDNVAHAAHFGGMLLGLVWMKWGERAGWWWRGRAQRVAEDYSREATEEDEEEMDRILEKIHREGLHSLSMRERMFLQDMSRRKRDRFR